ncbi:transmembrane protein 53-like [Diretmus argenteus]
MSGEVSQQRLASQKLSKSITYYYTPITAAEDSTKDCPAPATLCPSALSSASSLSDSPASSSNLLQSSSSSSPLLSNPPTPLSSQTTQPSDPAAPIATTSSSSPRPLLLLLPWLGAKPIAVAKYRDLYLEHGVDVLVVESNVMHFLWPRWGLDYGLEILTVLDKPQFSGRPLLVHSCSIGGYTFSQILTHIAQRPEEHAGLAQRMIGHVYDSLVVGTLEHMATGLGRTLLPRFPGLVTNAAMFYFWLFKTHTADYYHRSIHVFQNNPVTAPALFFFCENDAMCDPVVMETVIDLWRKRGVAVESRKWKESVHAAHLRCHPEDYLSTFEKFMTSLPISSLKAKM